MKTEKRADPKYPVAAILSDGTEILVPRQSKFSDEWLRKHGCSLVAEFEALQFLKVKKKWWPIYLLKWHRKNTLGQIYAKVTIKGVAEGINELADGKGTATYGPTPTEKKIQTALDAGAMVLFERGAPIHTLALIKDDGQVYKLNAGRVTKSSAEWAAKVATKSERYRGFIIVKRSKK